MRLPRTLMILAFLVVAGMPERGVGADEPVLKLSNDEDWPPFSHASLPQQGVANALVIAAFGAVDRKVDMRLLPWSRALELTRLQDRDALAGAFRTPEREKIYLYSDSFWNVRSILMARRGFPMARYQAFDDLLNYRVGVIQDNAAPRGFLNSGLDFRKAPSRASNLKKLAYGRVDIIFDVELPLLSVLDEIGLKRAEFVILEPHVGSNTVHLIVAKDHPRAAAIIEAFNLGLRKIRENGLYGKIANDFHFPIHINSE